MTESGPRDSLPPGSSGEAAAAAASPGLIAQFDLTQILASVGEVAYDWCIDTDVLLWSGNAAEVLLIRDIAAVSSGRAYAQLLETENAQARFDVVMQSDKRDDGHGVAYQIQYCIRPDPASRNQVVGRGYRPLVCRPQRPAGAGARRAARHQ